MELLMWMHLGGIASLLFALAWLSYRIGGAGSKDQYGPPRNGYPRPACPPPGYPRPEYR